MFHRESLDAELLRYNDQTIPDHRVRLAMLALVDHPTDVKCVDRLLRVFQIDIKPFLFTRVPPQLKQHPDLLEAFVISYIWLINLDSDIGLPRILGFKAWEASSTRQSIANWIYNYSFQYRIADLRKIKADRDPKRFGKSRKNPEAIDSSRHLRIGASIDKGDGTMVQDVPAPGLNLLEIAAHQAFYLELEDYLRRDPDGLLGQCQARDPRCNAHALVQCILQKDNRPSAREIEEEIGVKPGSTVDYQWNEKVLPLLTKVFIEIADRHDITVDLTGRHLKNSKKKSTEPPSHS
jgi:hypothetical protein